MRARSRRCFPTRPKCSRTCSKACSTSPRPTARSAPRRPSISPRSRGIFGLEQRRASSAPGPRPWASSSASPASMLGIDPLATDEQIREAWLRQVRANHPDRLMAQGLPEEAIKVANRKLAADQRRLRPAAPRARAGGRPDAMPAIIDRPSPNHAPRPDGPIVDMLVLHYTELPLQESLDILSDDTRERSRQRALCAGRRRHGLPPGARGARRVACRPLALARPRGAERHARSASRSSTCTATATTIRRSRSRR